MRILVVAMGSVAHAWRCCRPPVRRFGVAVWVLRVLVLTPSPLAADPKKPSHDVRVQDVLIEGKLYSPQAVFILSRPAQEFGSDAVLPHYLNAKATPRLLPYALGDSVLAAALSRSVVTVGDTLRKMSSVDPSAAVLDVDSRRSQ